MKNFIQRSFRRELLVSFLAVSVLPLIVCCVFLIQMFKVKVGRDFEKKDMELAGAVEQQLMTLFDAYHDAAEELCTDPLVADPLFFWISRCAGEGGRAARIFCGTPAGKCRHPP